MRVFFTGLKHEKMSSFGPLQLEEAIVSYLGPGNMILHIMIGHII